MTTTERKNVARANTLNLIMSILEENEAVQFADNSFAILQNVEGEEFWTEISVKTKANKATKISPRLILTKPRPHGRKISASRPRRRPRKKGRRRRRKPSLFL